MILRYFIRRTMSVTLSAEKRRRKTPYCPCLYKARSRPAHPSVISSSRRSVRGVSCPSSRRLPPPFLRPDNPPTRHETPHGPQECPDADRAHPVLNIEEPAQFRSREDERGRRPQLPQGGPEQDVEHSQGERGPQPALECPIEDEGGLDIAPTRPDQAHDLDLLRPRIDGHPQSG